MPTKAKKITKAHLAEEPKTFIEKVQEILASDFSMIFLSTILPMTLLTLFMLSGQYQ